MNDLDAIVAEFLQQVERGNMPNADELIARHPEHAAELVQFLNDLGMFGSFLGLDRSDDLALTTDYHSEPGTESIRFGEYELIEEIGRGGMGTVHRARVLGTQLVVALKQIQGQIDASTAQRFREEVETASGLRHPNIVPIYHVGELSGGPFYTMALIEGGSLDKQMARFRDHPVAIATLITRVARAIHYAHQRRVLHRDLKPSNVLLDDAGEPHVADFGLATRLDPTGSANTGGSQAGSLPWMAPETVRGESTLTTAIDVWAIGVIFYELLTGDRPFRGADRMALRQAILSVDPPTPRDLRSTVDRDLSAICMRCLAKDPEQRYESASALALDLDRWQRGEPVRARRLTSPERMWRWMGRNPVVAGGTVMTAIVLGIGAVSAASVASEQEARLRAEVVRGNEFAAHHIANSVLIRLREHGDLVLAAIDDSTLSKACRAGDFQRVEQELQMRFSGPEFATVFVLDPQGEIRAAAPRDRRVTSRTFQDRDYYRGAVARTKQVGRGRAHFSRVYKSVKDELDKLAISAAFYPDPNGPAWVIAATVPTDATLGVGGLHDENRKAVLIARRDTERGEPTEHTILVHPGYLNRESAVKWPSELTLTSNDDYSDPVAIQHPEYSGRWLAGVAPIPETELHVLVQQRYEKAMEPHRTVLRRTVYWLAAAIVIGAAIPLWARRRARSRA